MSLPSARSFHSGPANTVVGYGPLLVSVWVEQSRQVAAQQHTTAIERHREQHPRNVVVVLIEEGVAVPESAAREELARSMKVPAGATEGVAFCILGSGFGAATRRAVITGMQLVSRPRYPVRIFESLGSAGEWIAPLLHGTGLTLAPAEVARAIQEVRDAARVAARGA